MIFLLKVFAGMLGWFIGLYFKRKILKFEPIHYLIELIKWRFSPKKCIGLMFYYRGKMRVVVGETFQYFYIRDCKKGFLKSDYVLNNDKYIVLNCCKNGKYQEN